MTEQDMTIEELERLFDAAPSMDPNELAQHLIQVLTPGQLRDLLNLNLGQSIRLAKEGGHYIPDIAENVLADGDKGRVSAYWHERACRQVATLLAMVDTCQDSPFPRGVVALSIRMSLLLYHSAALASAPNPRKAFEELASLVGGWDPKDRAEFKEACQTILRKVLSEK